MIDGKAKVPPEKDLPSKEASWKSEYEKSQSPRTSQESVKYSMVYIEIDQEGAKRGLGYDNEKGKGRPQTLFRQRRGDRVQRMDRTRQEVLRR